MRYSLLAAIVLATCFTAHAQESTTVTTDANQPNIIVFLVDDMGWMDTSVAFDKTSHPLNERYRTPNMERLAKEGMVFTNAYAAPVCTPSRSSLMSGMNAAHTRITNWTSPDKNVPSDGESKGEKLLPPKWNINGFSPKKGIENTQYGTPLPELMKEAGYYTIHVGKAHFAASGTPGASPYNMGFLVNVSGTMVGMPQSYYGTENYGNIPDKTKYQAVQNMTEYYGTDTYLTEALTLEAKKALDYPIKQHKPFFLYMAHYAVHAPIMSDPRFLQNYDNNELDKGQIGYATMVEGMDKSLGDFMDYLTKEGVADNTVIIFMSDNGGNSIAKGKGGEKHTQNLPLREGKASVYEGGIREPMIVKWPGVVKPGTRMDQPVIIEDFYPSLLEIAGAKDAKPEQEIDGQSFVSLLRGESNDDPDRALFWNYPDKWKNHKLSDVDFLSAVRKGDWKLVYRMENGTLELYNLKKDIGERNNVAAEHPDKVKELAKTMGDKFRKWDAQRPTYKATGQPVPWPDELEKK